MDRFGKEQNCVSERQNPILENGTSPFFCHIGCHGLKLIHMSRIALENKAAAEEPPKKRRKKNEGSQAKDMTLVTSANVNNREGWQVSSLGRITRPIKMRPERPLSEIQHEKPKSTLKNQVRASTTGEKKRDKRIKDPDSRARRRTIDMTKWGSTHLKGMFLDMPALGMKRLKVDDVYDPTLESENEESGDDNERLKVSRSSAPSPLAPLLPTDSGNTSNIPTLITSSIKPRPSVEETLLLPDNSTDLEVEKTQSLNILASLFGGRDENWVRPESVGSDIDVDELMKGDVILVDDDDNGIEVVPIDDLNATMEGAQNDEEDNQVENREKENLLARAKPMKSTELKAQTSTKLKDLFAPREEEGNALRLL